MTDEFVLLMRETRKVYGYDESSNAQYWLLRNGVVVLEGSEARIWDFLHYGMNMSVYDALHFNGFTIMPTDRKEG